MISMTLVNVDISRYSKHMNKNGVERAIQGVVGRESTYLKNAMARPTKTWRHQPHFEVNAHFGGWEWYVSVITDDDIYFYLDQGTDIRYAVMTDDFIPKTTPYRLRAVRGQGGKSHMDYENPRQGIDARMFTVVARDLRQPKFERNMERAIRRIVGDLF